jgi:ribosomal protein S18 acetylase RimI-like enzyme
MTCNMNRSQTEAKDGMKPDAVWRPLSASDIKSLVRVADKVHPDLPESDEVFAERVKLFPQGCQGLVNSSGELCGYTISHPIRYRQPPALDQLLGEIAPNADQYYIHDLAILSELRGRGLADECVNKILNTVANKFPTTSLVSVYNTASFWGRYKFVVPESINETLKEKLVGYGDDATYLERKM